MQMSPDGARFRPGTEALNGPQLVTIVEPIESSSRRIKRVILGAGALALVAPVGGLSFAFATHDLRHAYWARWSPNGKHLAFVVVSPRGHGSQPLEVANANGTGLANLTGKWFVAQAPAWSPRGAKLAFVRMTNVSRPNETSSLWTIDTATRVKKRLAVSAVRFDLDSQLAWSPNGSWIALSRLDEAVRNYRIYTVKANGGGLRVLTEGRRPNWSPDGRTIVFDTGTGLPGFVPGVGVVNADGTDVRLLANSGTQPRFSPDGTQIVFNRGGEIWTMNADGSDQKQLTQASEPDFAPVWSPNGRMIAFLRGTPPQLYVMNVDGSGKRALAPSPAWELDPDWSPDGKRISFARCTSGLFRTCDVNVANVG
jgi:Tol biopolymer transport system component